MVMPARVLFGFFFFSNMCDAREKYASLGPMLTHCPMLHLYRTCSERLLAQIMAQESEQVGVPIPQDIIPLSLQQLYCLYLDTMVILPPTHTLDQSE